MFIMNVKQKRFSKAVIWSILYIFLLTLIQCKKGSTAPENMPLGQLYMADIDGNMYKTVKIGDQIWMAENLRVTHFRNGDNIPQPVDTLPRRSMKTSAYLDYGRKFTTEHLGHLYNWHAVNDFRGLAPEGWRVPSETDWQKLVDYLGGAKVAGGKMKDDGFDFWREPNTGATNESGFNAKPSGPRYLDERIDSMMGWSATFWSATEEHRYLAFIRHLSDDDAEIQRYSRSKESYCAIRCIKGEDNVNELVSIYISSTHKRICRGGSYQFVCKAHYKNGPTMDATSGVQWSCSPGIAASINEKGLFFADEHHTGFEQVMVHYEGKSDTISVEVMDVPAFSTVEDVDGNIYRTVLIDGREWIAENLRVTHFRNGDRIPTCRDSTNWETINGPTRCTYGNRGGLSDTYGFLYNYAAIIDNRGIGPEGWHVPDEWEWRSLAEFYGWGEVGGCLKETGNAHWLSPNPGATNESGFSALPGGYRLPEGNFRGLGETAEFWSLTNSNEDYYCSFGLYKLNSDFSLGCSDVRHYGYSVRLVRDK